MTSSRTLGPHDLILCSGTLLTCSMPDMVKAAAAAGYSGITLWPTDVARARAEGYSTADLNALLEDHGIVVHDLDPLLGWTPQAIPDPGESKIQLAPESEFYELAEAFGARTMNVAQGFGAELDLDRAAEDLAGVCDRAKEHGLIVTVEFLPWSGIPNADVACELIRRTSRDNATLMVDAWHWFRGGAHLDMLRGIPGAWIGGVQLNDAPADAPADIVTETMAARLKPGDGGIPLGDVIRVLDEIGSKAPLGVEVFHAEHASMDPVEVAQNCADATRRVLEEARPARP